MNRRTKTSEGVAPTATTMGSAAVRLSPGRPASTAGPTTSSGAESGVESDAFGGGRRTRERAQQRRRKRMSRPAVEDIIDGFAICSFETVKDLTMFIEKKTMIQSHLESSSSESEFEPLQPSSTKSSDAASLSSSSKPERKRAKAKHFQLPRFTGSRVEYVESSDRSLSPGSPSSVIRSSSRAKVRTNVTRSENNSTGSGVSYSSTFSKSCRRAEDSDEKDSAESAAFSCVSGSALREEDEKANILSSCVSVCEGVDVERSKPDRSSAMTAVLTDAESESSVVLVKEELKEKDWVAGHAGSWSGNFPVDDLKRPEKRRCSNLTDSDFKKNLDNVQMGALPSEELSCKWTVIKENASLLKTEKSNSSTGLQSKHHFSPRLESHSRSFDRQRTAISNDLKSSRDYDFLAASKSKIINVSSPTRSDSYKKSHLYSLPRAGSSSNDLRTGVTKLAHREGPECISRSSFASVTLASTEIKNECASPISVRGSSSHQSSSRSSTSHKKSANSHSLGNDFSSLPLIDRNLHSPLAGHSAYHAGGRPHQPAAFNVGGLPMSGLFGPPLSQFPVSGLHPPGSLLGSSMGLHPSLLAAAPLMAGMNSMAANPVVANPDLFQVQQELNARFLQDHRLLPMGFPPVPLTLRTETHQHQHLHHHQHLVPTPYLPTLPASFSVASHPLSMFQTMGPMGPNGIDLLSHSQTLSDLAERERISKLRSSMNIFDCSLPPSYASLIPGIPPSHPAGLASNMHGAFTINESKSSLSASHLLRSLRNDQQVAQTVIPSVSTTKKTGQWCAAHVDIARRIYYHRQRSLPQENVVHGRPVAPSGGSNSSSLTGGFHHIQSLPSTNVMGNGINSFHKSHLQFGINSFLRPTPQSFHEVDANRFSSSPSISRPRRIGLLPGGIPKVEDSRDLKSSSSTLRSYGASDGNLLTSADQDHKRRLMDRDLDNLLEKKRKLDLKASADHPIAAAHSGRNSPHHHERSNLHNRSAANELSRSQRLPESHSPLSLSSDRPFRQNLDAKKRENLALPLSVDTRAGGRSPSAIAGNSIRHAQQSKAPPLNLARPGIMPSDSSVALQMDCDRLESLRRERGRLGQSFCGQSFISDVDRFRNLLPSHAPYGLSLNSLSKPEHESFKPYNDLSLRLDAKPAVDVFKPNPDGLFIVSSSSTRHFSSNAGTVSSVPPPLVRLPLNDGLSSFKRHAPYGPIGNGLSDFSSSLCGLPGGDRGIQLSFR